MLHPCLDIMPNDSEEKKNGSFLQPTPLISSSPSQYTGFLVFLLQVSLEIVLFLWNPSNVLFVFYIIGAVLSVLLASTPDPTFCTSL